MEHVLLNLYRSLSMDLIDCARITELDRCELIRDHKRDLAYLRRRFLKEGVSLITSALPAYAKHVTACLEAGSYAPLMGFNHGSDNLPRFMHGWVVRIFHRGTGLVLESPCPFAIRAVRQLALFASKAKTLPADHVCYKAYKEYADDEERLIQGSLWSKSISTFGYTAEVADQHFTVGQYFGTLGDLGRLFVQCGRAIGGELDRRHSDNQTTDRLAAQLWPKHGPGAVAERLDNDGKWRYITSTSLWRLDTAFDTFWLSEPEGIERTQQTADRLSRADPPARLIAVPKTSTTPRLIASEPTANQFWQQALMGWLKRAFDDSWIGRSIDLSDQGKSQHRALTGSTDRKLGTIDLSKASDSVTLDHLGALFQGDSELLHMLLACRTETIDVPGSGVIRLRKFASMGSATCFPIESVVFLAAVAASIMNQNDMRFTSERMREVCREITVYGDDIIAPTQYIPGVMRDLSSLGFIPNLNKSFYRSHFRESCGIEAYKGYLVKPVYIRRDFWLRTWLGDEDIVSLVSTSRQAYERGLWRTAELLLELVETRLGEELPYSEEPQLVLTHNIIWRQDNVQRWRDPDTHAPKVRGYCPVPKMVESKLDGYARLLRYLITVDGRAELLPMEVSDHDWSKLSTRGFRLVPMRYE